MIALFPGRFDEAHFGHVITIQRLVKKFDKLIVVVFGYDGEEYSLGYRYQLLKECCDGCRGDIEVFYNKNDWRDTRSGITKEDIHRFMKNYKFDVYCTGNHKYLKAAEEAGYSIYYVERSYEYNATDGRAIKNIKKILGQ